MFGKCHACDRRLTLHECALGAETCPQCRDELTRGYHANRALVLQRLVAVLTARATE